MSRESFCLLMSYNLFVLSFAFFFIPLFLSVEGSDNLGSQIALPSSEEHKFGPSSTCFGFKAKCPDSTSFCFPSAKPDFSVRSSQQHESGNTNPKQSVLFSLPNGGTVTCTSLESKYKDDLKSFGGYSTASCEAPLIPDDWMKASNGVMTDLDEGVEDAGVGRVNRYPSSLNVEIKPSILDWSVTSLYEASILTVNLANLHQDSVLDVYEPYCTDPQFYPYNFVELSIEPGENASIYFVFLPRSLGLSLAQIVLQTSFGGFVLQAKGVANESPYSIEPLVGIDLHIGEVLSKALSIHNPFEESIYVEEVAVWMSAEDSLSQSDRAICQLDMSTNSSKEVEWFNMGTEWHGLPTVYFKPLNNWKILPKSGDAIVEMRLQADVEAQVFGVICLKLRNDVTKSVRTVVVPLEMQVHHNPIHSALMGWGSVSASYNSHIACDGSGPIFTLYLTNDGSGPLRIMNIFEESESEKLYEIRYLRHLVLYPVTTTAVALINCNRRNKMSEISGTEFQCSVIVETNHSSNAFFRVPCQHFACTSSANVGASHLGSVPDRQQEEPMNANTRSFGGILQDSTEKKVSPFGEMEASNLILSNWFSHGKAAGTSLLINQIVLFPPVQIGSCFSQLITVKNPGPIPALVQLVMSSEELITDCKTSDDNSAEHTFSIRYPDIGASEMRFGFSVLDSGLMEVVLLPFESASLGPIIFQPLNRCTWSSSALIRNNVSGIEWVSLHASGGSHSISFLDGSEPVQKLEFVLDVDSVNNLSSTLQSEVKCPSCEYPFSKEIFAKNTGELLLEIKKIRVSGTDCRSDGFTISRNCLGFNLLPGESEMIGVSYHPDFLSGIVHRDLELVMAGGIFVIPMKAQVPVCMMSQCKKTSVFRRVSLLVAFAVVVMFVRLMPLSLTLRSTECYFRLDNGERCAGQDDKRLFFHYSNKASRSVAIEQKKQEQPAGMPRYSVCQNAKQLDPDFTSSDQLKKSPTPSRSLLKPKKDPVPAPVETSQNDNTSDLSIKVVREKAKRRKKRTSNNNSNLAAKLEVSSSHSSNSTPSSPLSSSGSTPKQSWARLPDCDRTASPCRSIVSREPVNVASNIENEPSYYPSLVFSGPHVSDSIFLAKTSPIAPHARAPGPKVVKEKCAKMEDELASAKQYTYDMWADHFSGHAVYSEGRDADYSNSFFVVQPHASSSYSENLNKTGYVGDVTGVSGMN